MGLDFITKCTPTFQRSWDQGRTDLREPDLFQRHPELEGRTFRLSPADGSRLAPGEEILLRWCGGELTAYRGRTLVGVVGNPPPALTAAINEPAGAVCARVERIHPRSGAADISVVP